MTSTGHPISASRAFTLIESVAAIALTSILLAGLGSMMVVASHAVPTRDSTAIEAIETRRALTQLTDELASALTVDDRTSTSITFTVADRNGDGLAETITYSWSGVAGDPLTRAYNGVSANVVDSVSGFDLTYDISTITVNTGPSTPTEGAEQLVISQDVSNAGVPNTFAINNSNQLAELLKPSLPADATGWRITRLLLQANPSGGSNGVVSVEIRNVGSGNLPTGATVEAQTVNESSLVSNNWCQVSFTNAGPLDPTAGAFVVVRYLSGSATVASIRIGEFSNATPETEYYTSTDSGTTWTTTANSNTWLYVYAVPIQPAGATPVTLNRIDRAGVSLTTAGASLSATAPMLNRPDTP